jgi:hypothetical protein
MTEELFRYFFNDMCEVLEELEIHQFGLWHSRLPHVSRVLGLPALIGLEVKIESIEKVERGYKATGSHEYRSFLGQLVENGF